MDQTFELRIQSSESKDRATAGELGMYRKCHSEMRTKVPVLTHATHVPGAAKVKTKPRREN